MKLPREIKIYAEILLIVFAFYFIVSSVAPSSRELFLWVIASITLLSVPLLTKKERKNSRKKEKSKILVRNDISHFKEVVNKALEENSVAQRDVELELLNVLRIDLRIRYSLSDREIRERMGNEKFLRKYFGENWKTIKEIYDRKHDLRKSVPREKFLRDVNTLMEVMK